MNNTKCSIKTLTGFALLVFALGSSYASAANPPYPVLEPDAEIRLNVGMINDALQNLLNTEYRATYDLDKPLCRTPNITAKLNAVSLKTSSRINLLSTIAKTDVGARVFFGGKIDDCRIPAGFAIECKAALNDFDLDKRIPITGNCRYLFVVLSLPMGGRDDLDLGGPIGPIINLSRQLDLKIRDTKHITVEFGKFVDGKWVTAAVPHERQVHIAASVFGAEAKKQGHNLRELDSEEDQLLVGQFSVGNRFFDHIRGVDDAVKRYTTVPGFDRSKTIVQIALRPSFFAKTSNQDKRGGLFNELLPIRLTGAVKGQRIDIALTGAKVEFGRYDDKDAIRASFDVRSISTGAYIENASAYMVFSFPEISSGHILTHLITGRIQISTKDFGANVCLDWLIRDNFDFTFLDLGALKKELILQLPDCIDAHDDKFVADRACAGGARRGHLSRHGTMTNVNIQIHGDRATIDRSGAQTLVVNVPADIVLFH